MSGDKYAPFFILALAASLITALVQWNRTLSMALIMLGVGLVGFTIRIFQIRAREREGREPPSINWQALRSCNIQSYAPWLKTNVRGHDHVIDEITTRLQQNLLLANPKRSLGAFLLVGPTGTGKTFLAQLCGQALFPGSEPLILRMNQYKQSEDVFTLLGPPPGSPGWEVGGSLTRPVLENPMRLILLDELDKAHPDVIDALYDILDTASCREKSSGKRVAFNACAFFGTSNLGVEALRRLRPNTDDTAAWIATSRDAMESSTHFEKSFLARWDQILLMDELSPLHVAEVVCLNLAKQWKEYGIEVSYASPEVILQTVQRNKEFKEYGVRQLANYIRQRSDQAISEAMRMGIKSIRLDLDGDGKLVFKAVRAKANVRKAS